MKKSTNKQKEQSKNILLSVALQELYTKKMPLLAKPAKPKATKVPSISAENDKNVHNIIYDRENYMKTQGKNNKQYIINKAKRYKQERTLAEKLNLIPSRPAPLDEKLWEKVKSEAAKKENVYESCAICLQDFRMEPQLLLNCEHSFHKCCFLSFEKHANTRKCPLCRSENYEYIEINTGAEQYINTSAARIQKWVRGAIARNRFWARIDSDKIKLSSARIVNRRLAYRMACLNQRLKKSSREQYNTQLSDMKNTEQILGNTRELIASYYTAMKQKNQTNAIEVVTNNWPSTREKFSQRKSNDCSICLTSMNGKFSLLSCSHGFHVQCLEFFERNCTKSIVCPLCRLPYIKKIAKISTLKDK